MDKIFLRTELLLGEDKIKKLKNSSVIVFGLGGVGGHAVEALVRSGIGRIGIVDKDVFDITNLNRQLFATIETIGRKKTDVVLEKLMKINPELKIDKYDMFYLPSNSNEIELCGYDYIVDAIDTVTSKIELIKNAKEKGIKIISSMGTGNKLNPSLLKISDIYKTDVCPLARVMRRELKKRNIKELTVLYSTEKPHISNSHVTPSNAFVPSVAGILIGSHVVYDLCDMKIN